jgi:hypothetical protein
VRRLFKLGVAAATSALALSMIAAPAAQAAPASTGGNLTQAQSRALYEKITSLLPAGAQSQVAALGDRLGLTEDSTAQDVINAVIDPADYKCTDTPATEYVQSLTAGLTQDDLLDLAIILIYDPVDYDALYFPEPAATRHFGVDGEYTARLQRRFAGLKGFWDIKSSGIELVPVHGSTLLDTTRVARALKAELPTLTDDGAAQIADLFRQIADQDKFDHGNFPLFTFNAFAFSAKGEPVPGVGTVTDKILVGDGVLEGMKTLGLDDIAPDAIISHEFGHHVQYQDGLDTATTLTGPEASRRLELMADTFGSYYLTHLRGGHVGLKRVQDFVKLFYDLGDCQFTNDGHHGTPDQRGKAAEFGALNALLPVTRVLPSRTLYARFEKALPKIVAPDATSMTAADIS